MDSSWAKVIIPVLLASMFVGVGAMYERMDRISSRVMHKDYLESRLKTIEFRLVHLEENDAFEIQQLRQIKEDKK